MTPIDAIGFIEPAVALPAMPGVTAAEAAAPGRTDFSALVSQGLDSVNGDWQQAQSSMRALAEGQSVNLHQVMMKMEESRLSFQLFMQVRNRVLESYQDVMRMQV